MGAAAPRYWGYPPTDEANALLIAAAPDLLAACRALVAVLRDANGTAAIKDEDGNYYTPDNEVTDAVAAIAKARGELKP